MEEKGRSFSGGQRQRLVLVRALLADPAVLVLVEPTSAVDAHTEARIADRLRASRAGRTTVVYLEPAAAGPGRDVVFVAAGRVVATGMHRDLLETDPRYAQTVTRETGRAGRSDGMRQTLPVADSAEAASATPAGWRGGIRATRRVLGLPRWPRHRPGRAVADRRSGRGRPARHHRCHGEPGDRW